MNFEELDIALEELETRLERLRALYEQYFLGFEKIEPAVARKDVDRRIYLLRREKIRNTGKRFKLQTIIQRYNTFQQYWQRICREIENGTYKRHLARAERILGPDQMLTIAARRRFGRAAAERLTAEAEPEGDASPLDDIEAEPGELAAMSQSSEPAPEVHADRAPLPPIPRAPVPSRLPIPGTVPPNAASRTARPSKFESLSLDMDFLDTWNPETSVRARHRGSLPKDEATPPAPAPKAPAAAAPPNEPFLPAKSAPTSAPPPAPLQMPSREPFPRAKSAPSAAPPPTPPSEPSARPLPSPASPARAAPPPKPERAAAKRPPVPVPSAPPNVAPAAAKPAIAKIAPAEKRVAPAAAKASTLSDERIRELHENLVRMKRENKEPGQVSMDSLAKTLRATEEKLRAEHKNRRIEFDVVLRDGKAVVKPKVR